MAEPKWEETAPIEIPQVSQSSAVPQWEETVPVEPDTPASSPAAAAATGLLNGATANWAPAIGAAGQTAMNAITGVHGPLAGGSLDDLVDEYRTSRDKLKADFAKAAAAHPHIALAGNLAGGAASLGLAGPAAASSSGLAATGAIGGLGASNADLTQGEIGQAAKDTALGAATTLAGGKAIEAAAPIVGKMLAPVSNVLSSGAQSAAESLGGKAEGLAEKATGATGKEASNFVPGTGRELLDRKIVKFGSSPADIAANADSAMDAAEASKADIVKNKLQGTNVDRNTVYNYIRNKIQSLSGDESQVGLVKSLESKLDDITGVADQAGTDVPLADSEGIRRGFDKNAKWDSNSDAPTREANKVAANAYREAGEEAATAADPELGAQFKADKDTQHLLIPVQEAAARRASQLAQSPHGGLLDAAWAGSGGAIGTMIGGPIGGVIGGAAGLGAKALRPRMASAAAVTADQLSKVVAASPAAFGKFADVLTSAAARGSAGLNATDYILQQTNPDYREQRKRALEPEDNDEPLQLARGPGSKESVQ